MKAKVEIEPSGILYELKDINSESLAEFIEQVNTLQSDGANKIILIRAIVVVKSIDYEPTEH